MPTLPLLLMKLATAIDEETKELFGKFCTAALAADNTNRFVKDALRCALEQRKAPPVEGKVIDVKDVK
jgi:hypothetical protein